MATLSPSSKKFLSILTEFLAIPSPSGREEEMAGAIRRHLEALGYTPETDASGNVFVRLEGRNPHAPLAMFAAHMDEIGVVVTQVEADGTLRINRSGALSPFKLGERPIQFLGDRERITGVISFGSGHTAGVADGISWQDVRVITGLSKEQLKKAGIRPGTTGVPVSEGRGPILFGDPENPLVATWTLDDRAGVIAQLQMLEMLKARAIQPPCPTIVAFTVHEEGGCHGAKGLANREKPELFIAIDGCPWKPDSGVEVNDRPTAWSMDNLAHYDQRFITTMATAAENAGTEIQVVVLSGAYSDASSVYAIGAAARVAVLGHIRYNSHGFEVAQLAIFSNLVNTLVELFKLEKW